jgi:outer membrane protein assembly factor BamB
VYAASSKLYALDAVTGKKKWSFTPAGGYTTSSPAVAGGTVYIGQESGVYAIDAATGKGPSTKSPTP